MRDKTSDEMSRSLIGHSEDKNESKKISDQEFSKIKEKVQCKIEQYE